EGGEGNDKLIGPALDSTWIIDGNDAGKVGAASFTGVENLEGAADNEDTFVFQSGGRISGLVDGGLAGFDSLAVKAGSHTSATYTMTGPNSGTITIDGVLIGFDGLEPVSNSGTAADIIFDLTGVADSAVLEDIITPGSRLRSVTGTFETTTFGNPVSSLTVNLLGGADTLTINALDAAFAADVTINGGLLGDTVTVNAVTGAGTYRINGGAGADQIHVGAIGAHSLTVAGGADGDTYFFDDNWGQVTVIESGAGIDTLDFSAFSGSLVIDVKVDGSIDLVGSDGSKVILSAATVDFIEAIEGENFNLTGTAATVKDELVGGLEGLVTFMRHIAEIGGLATSLPLLGGSADVAVSKAVDFAEAIDELRLEVEEFFDSHPIVTTDDLIGYLNTAFAPLAKVLEHLGPSVLSPSAITGADIAASDVYEFELVVDGTTVTLIVDVDAAVPAPTLSNGGSTVTVGIAPTGPYTVDQLVSAITAGLSTLDATAGNVVATERDGRLALQAVGTEIENFAVEALGGPLGAAVAKLGFVGGVPVVLDNVQEILRGLGDLNLTVGSGIALDVVFDNGTPQLRFDVDYLAQRETKFFFNLGDQAQALCLSFDLD